ncbi:MAG: c-type cytochrome [Campylobacteraceae bacterium]|nr:c-type cytochrome [Campylobacteraceae bacterium]
MREFKILTVVLFFTALIYWGVEPFAHSQMHPHVAPADFDFAKGDIAYAKEVIHKAQTDQATAEESLKKLQQSLSERSKIEEAQKAVDSSKKVLAIAQEELVKITSFWKELEPARQMKGSATKGAETFMSAGCIGCHGVKSQGMAAPMDNASASVAFGVVPPDLSNAGLLYDKSYLIALIKEPTRALKVEHKFNETKPHPMIAFFGLGGDINQEIADIVAYLQSIAPKELDAKQTFEDACQRCHDIKYDKVLSNSNQDALKAYMGTTPPDLSMMIRAKSKDYLSTFINNPQKQLAGTSMPRVGLTEVSQNKVVAYMEKVGDRKKAERDDLGYKLIAYMALFTLLAYLWKVKIWRKVH